jgi:hypothetical protein
MMVHFRLPWIGGKGIISPMPRNLPAEYLGAIDPGLSRGGRRAKFGLADVNRPDFPQAAVVKRGHDDWPSFSGQPPQRWERFNKSQNEPSDGLPTFFIKACLTVAVFASVAIFCESCSKGKPTPESYHWPDPFRNSGVTNISLWTVDEETPCGQPDTNGLSVMLELRNHSFLAIGEELPPTCMVAITSTTTNLFNWCWEGDGTNLMKIELLDSTGKPVEKTAEGLKYGSFLSEQQYDAFFKSGKRPVHLRGYAFISTTAKPPLIGGYNIASFSLPELFKITQPGEYTLRVQIRMGQMDYPEKKLKRLIMPPEVSATIQIHPADLPLPKFPPDYRGVAH